MKATNQLWSPRLRPFMRNRLIALIVTLKKSNPDVDYTERDFIRRQISNLENI